MCEGMHLWLPTDIIHRQMMPAECYYRLIIVSLPVLMLLCQVS